MKHEKPVRADPMPDRCSGCCQHVDDCDCPPSPLAQAEEHRRHAAIMESLKRANALHRQAMKSKERY